MGLTDLGVAELQEIIRGKSWDVALFTTAPLTDGTGGVEVTGTGYARVSFAGSNFTAPDATRVISNSIAIEFPAIEAAWGEVKAAGLYDGSDLWLVGGVSPSKVVTLGQSPLQFAVGDLQFQLT